MLVVTPVAGGVCLTLKREPCLANPGAGFNTLAPLNRAVPILYFLVSQQCLGVGLMHNNALVQHIGAV